MSSNLYSTPSIVTGVFFSFPMMFPLMRHQDRVVASR